MNELPVSAIIAAFNEEETLAGVLESLISHPLIDEIIVVSDGSTDRTVEIARSYEVRTIALAQNQGKGYAMRLGVDHASHDILFFVDADMFNLTEEHLEALVNPVVLDECDMNVGVRHRGPLLDVLHLKLHFGPVLSGIRVMRRSVFDVVPPKYVERYKVESALNFFCDLAGYRQKNTIVYDLGHVIKERKRGAWAGLVARWTMSREVFRLQFELYVLQTWALSRSHERPVSEYELFEAEMAD